jgi:hypothetical protein
MYPLHENVGYVRPGMELKNQDWWKPALDGGRGCQGEQDGD